MNKVLADGAYDSKDIFDYLEEKGIEAGIKVRKNSSTRSSGSPSRRKAVLELKELRYDRWKEKKGYGYRWMSETVFSCFKNMFGEFIRARAIKNMTKEIGLKVFIFHKMMNV